METHWPPFLGSVAQVVLIVEVLTGRRDTETEQEALGRGGRRAAVTEAKDTVEERARPVAWPAEVPPCEDGTEPREDEPHADEREEHLPRDGRGSGV